MRLIPTNKCRQSLMRRCQVKLAGEIDESASDVVAYGMVR